MKLFAQIRKVDEAQRLVYGRAAEEAVDKADEIMDYASSKPHFMKWSADIAADTDGRSLGNVRAMHGKVAAGKLTAIEFNDGDRAVDVCAKVVDDGEWKKVLEGVYTGFSIGGSYVGEKKVEKADGRDVVRYTAKPTEISLVDRPCMPGARFFEVQKADGTLAKVDFQSPDGVADDADVTVTGTADEIAALGKMMNEHGLTLADLLTKAVPAFIAEKEKGDKTSTDPDGDGDAAADKDGDGDGGKAAGDKAPGDGAAAPVADDAEKAAGLALDGALQKLGTDLTDAATALEKVAADSRPAIAAQLQKAADQIAQLLDVCGAQPLAKRDDGAALQKMVNDAVLAAVDPLQKALDAANVQITKLAAQPAPARVSLRAVAKADDLGVDAAPVQKAAPVVDTRGEAHEAAGLIKSLHAGGGQPLTLRK